jgi:hypothetical protein
VTTTPDSPATSQQAAVDAALLVLKSMGLSLDDLLSAGTANRKPVPTFAEYVPQTAASAARRSARSCSLPSTSSVSFLRQAWQAARPATSQEGQPRTPHQQFPSIRSLSVMPHLCDRDR